MLKSMSALTLGFLLAISFNAQAQKSPIVDGDADGVPDEIDACPYTMPGTKVDRTGCPLSGDADGDGVSDDRDDCPYTPHGARVDAHGCAIDSDFDGVPDGIDQCPKTPYGEAVDERGCADGETSGHGAPTMMPTVPAPRSRAAEHSAAAKPSAAFVEVPSAVNAPPASSPVLAPPSAAPASKAAIGAAASRLSPRATPIARPAAPSRSVPAPTVVIAPGVAPVAPGSAPTVVVQPQANFNPSP